MAHRTEASVDITNVALTPELQTWCGSTISSLCAGRHDRSELPAEEVALCIKVNQCFMVSVHINRGPHYPLNPTSIFLGLTQLQAIPFHEQDTLFSWGQLCRVESDGPHCFPHGTKTQCCPSSPITGVTSEVNLLVPRVNMVDYHQAFYTTDQGFDGLKCDIMFSHPSREMFMWVFHS